MAHVQVAPFCSSVFCKPARYVSWRPHTGSVENYMDKKVVSEPILEL